MMKKIFALVFILVLGKMSYSQTYPLQQNLGSDSTIVISKGALQSRLAPIVISDTTAANNQRIKNYPGAQLYTANGDFYVRNATATKWVLVSSGSSGPINIYNSDGTLTGNRVLTGAGNSLTFNGISGLGINKVADSVFTVEGGIHATGGLRLDNLTSSPGTKTLRIDGQGVVSVADTSVVISIATNNGTGITGGTITSTGTLAIDTTIISTRAWRQKGIDSVAALPKVTSVGLTMPIAFNVSGSPVTSAGTLSVTAAGVASQYIRGDGQLATLPTMGGGGSSVSYYLNGSVNQGTFGGNTYYQMNKTPVIGTGTDFTISSNGYIASFITDAGDPDLLNIPAGNWDFEIYFQSSSSSGTPSFYVELYKYNGTTFTLIASSSTNPKFITSGTTVDAYYTPLPVPATTLAITDRLAIRVYVNNSGNTITLHTEDNNLCQVITTFSTGINALNGLTDQVQYFAVGTSGTDFNISSLTDTHTFNLPTASATNRGALSSADWTTFNSKISPSDTASMLAPYLRKADTTAMLANYVNNVGYGLSKAGQVVSADSATLANYFLRRKDSLTSTNLLGYVTRTILADTAAAIRSADAGGTVTSIATNNGTGITGGTITTTGTLAIDTLLISTRAWRQKGVDSVAALVNSNVSGTTNRVSKFTGANTIGNSSIADSSVVGVAMTISSFANVGIGTATPSSKLEVSGNATIKTNFASLNLDNTTSTTPVWMKINNGGGNYLMGVANNSGTTIMSSTTSPYAFVINAQSSRDVVIGTNDLERMRVDSTGKVGIGTTTIDSMLTVAQGAYFQRGVRMSGLPTAVGTKALRIDANGTLSVADTTTGGGGGIGGSGTTNRLAKFTASGTIGNSSIADSSSSVAMTISSGGNLGVGVVPSPWGSAFRALQLGNGGSIYNWTGGNLGNVTISSNAYEDASLVSRYINTNGASTYLQNNGEHRWSYAASGTAGNAITYTTGMNLNNSGNLGINTTTIGSRLQVNGNAAIGYSASTAAPTNGLAVSGQVIIGATTPTGTLGVTGASGTGFLTALRLDNSTNNAYQTFSFGGTVAGGVASLVNANIFEAVPFSTGNFVISAFSNNMVFMTNNRNERMRITSGGSIGIGTTTIGSTLQVNGNAAIGYNASTAAPTNGLMVAGNVGVNVTPSAWASGFRAIQIGARTSFYNSDINFTGISNNSFYDGTFWRYLTTAATSSIELGVGVITFGNAPSGTAGATVSGTERARIHTDGIFYIGNGDAVGTPNTGIVSATGGTGTNVAGAEFRIRGGASTGNAAGGIISFYTAEGGTSGTSVNSTIERVRIAADGALSVRMSKTSTTNYFSSARILIQQTNNTSNNFANLSFLSAGSDDVAAIWSQISSHTAGASTGNLVFGTTNAGAASTARMTITSTGLVGINTQTIGSQLQVNGGAAIGYSASTAAPTNGLAVSGNVGVGTTTPGYTATSRQVVAINGGSAAGQGSILAFMQAGVNKGYVFSIVNDMEVWCESGTLTLGNNAAAPVVLKPNNTDRLTVTSGGQVTLATGANVSAIAQTGYSLTGSNASSLIDLAGTWNTTGNPTAIKLNITNTASGASAYLMDLQVGGTTQFRVTKDGSFRTTAPTGGTAANWKVGSVATVTPTSPNRTIEVEIDGVIYYIHAKTTNN